MNVVLVDQKVKVYIQHHSCIGYEDMFHIVVLLRLIFIPNEISDESLHDVSIPAELLQKIALAFKHALVIHCWIFVLTLYCSQMLL